MGTVTTICSHLPKNDRIIRSRVNAVWTKHEGWDGCAEAQFYEKGEEIQYIEWTCFGCKPFMHSPKTIRYSDVVEVLHEEKWKKKSETNGGYNPAEEQFLKDVLLLMMKDGSYYRMAPIKEDQIQKIKEIILGIGEQTKTINAPKRQSIELEIIEEKDPLKGKEIRKQNSNKLNVEKLGTDSTSKESSPSTSTLLQPVAVILSSTDEKIPPIIIPVVDTAKDTVNNQAPISAAMQSQFDV